MQIIQPRLGNLMRGEMSNARRRMLGRFADNTVVIGEGNVRFATSSIVAQLAFDPSRLAEQLCAITAIMVEPREWLHCGGAFQSPIRRAIMTSSISLPS